MFIKLREHKMNIIEEKVLQNLKENDLNIIIKEKGDLFSESDFENYSKKDLVINAKRYVSESTSEGLLVSLIFISIGMAFSLHEQTILYYAISIIPGIIGLFLIPRFLDKIKRNLWIRKEKNIEILKYDLFKDTNVDKEVLKSFGKSYGKENLLNLLKEKKSPTYKDVLNKIKNIEEEIDKNKQTNKELQEEENLKKAVECLLTE